MPVKPKYKIESTTPGFVELEKALHKANDKIGWKYITAFLVSWANKNQPNDTGYSLKFWLKQIKN